MGTIEYIGRCLLAIFPISVQECKFAILLVFYAFPKLADIGLCSTFAVLDIQIWRSFIAHSPFPQVLLS